MVDSQMTSMRVPEDHMLLLDQRVGFDGMRNRSDVIRAAIALYLESTPTNADVRTVKVDIGTQTRFQLAELNELYGTSEAEALHAGLDLYLIQKLGVTDSISKVLDARVQKFRVETRAHEDHTE